MSSIEGKQEGKVDNRGKAAVNAAETPYGKYHRKVAEVIDRNWQRAISLQSDFSTVGYMRVEFFILPDGTTEGWTPFASTRQGVSTAAPIGNWGICPVFGRLP